VRLSANEALRPVSEGDLYDVRRVVRQLELRLAPTPSLLKLALELRPDRVVLASEPTQSRLDAAPLDSAALRHALPPAARALREAGIPVWVRIAPEPESVKLARGAEIAGVELSSVGTVDLPESERAAALERFGDAARLAAKLRLPIGVAGRLEAGRVRASSWRLRSSSAWWSSRAPRARAPRRDRARPPRAPRRTRVSRAIPPQSGS